MLTEVDADLLLQDFGSSVVAGAVSGLGILDEMSQIIMGDQVISVDYLLTVRTDKFGHLGYMDTVLVNGRTYRVQYEPLRMADGQFAQVALERV